MRLIAGTLKGRRLSAPAGRKVRPTGERLKESLFSALGGLCRGASVLDLFAGSGNLGFEALSRGAALATFVEKDRAVWRCLKANAAALGVEANCRIICAEAFAFIAGPAGETGYSLIFADPPFDSGFAGRVYSWWLESGARNPVLVLQYPSSEPPTTDQAGPAPLKSATFGESSYSIFLRE